MASEPDQGQDGKQDADAMSEKEDRAGENDKAGIDDRAGASPAPTIHEEAFDIPSDPDDGEGELGRPEEQEVWEAPSPVDFFQDLGYGPAPGGRGSLRD